MVDAVTAKPEDQEISWNDWSSNAWANLSGIAADVKNGTMTAVSGAGSTLLSDPLGAAKAFGSWAYGGVADGAKYVGTGLAEIPNMSVGHVVNLAIDGAETGATSTVGLFVGAIPDAVNAIAGLGGEKYKMYSGSAIGTIGGTLQKGIDGAEGFIGIEKPKAETPGERILHGTGTVVGAVATGTVIVKGLGAVYSTVAGGGEAAATTATVTAEAPAAAAAVPTATTATAAPTVAATTAAPSVAPTSIMASKDAFISGVGTTSRAAASAAPEGAASFTAGTSAAGGGSGTAGAGLGGAAAPEAAAAAAAPQAATGSQSWLSAQWMNARRPIHITADELWKNGRQDLAEQFLARARVAGFRLAERDGIAASNILPQAIKDAVREQYMARTSLLGKIPESLRATTAYAAQYPGSAAFHAATTPVKLAARTAWDMATLPARPILSPVATFFGASRAGQWGSVIRGASGLAVDEWLFDGAVRNFEWDMAKKAGSAAVPFAQKGAEAVAAHTSGTTSAAFGLLAGQGGFNNLGEAAGKLGTGLFEGAANNLWVVIPALLGALMGGSGPNGRLLPAIILAVVGAGLGYAVQSNMGGVQDGLKSVFGQATNAMGLGEIGQQTIAANPKTIRPPVMAMAPG